MPTLADAIRTAGDRIKLNIELKFHRNTKNLVEGVVETVNRMGFRDRCILTSLDHQALLRVKAIDPEIRTGFVIFSAIGNASRLDGDALSVEQGNLSKLFLAEAWAREKEIHVWTVNSRAEMMLALDVGVDNIITDHPERLRHVLAERAGMGDLERILMRFESWLEM